MKRTLTLLVASTALTAAIGLPAWGAMRDLIGDSQPFTEIAAAEADALPLILAGNADDGPVRRAARRSHDDDNCGVRRAAPCDHEDEDEDDDDEDDDDDDGGHGLNPAPAGSVAPPQNGLFGNGSPPTVQMN